MTNDDIAPWPNNNKAFIWDGGMPEELSTEDIGGERATTDATHASLSGRFVAGVSGFGGEDGIVVWDTASGEAPRLSEVQGSPEGVDDEGRVLYSGQSEDVFMILESLDGTQVAFPPLYGEGRSCQSTDPFGDFLGPQGWILGSRPDPAIWRSPTEAAFIEELVADPPEGMFLYGAHALNGRGQLLATYAALDHDGTPDDYLTVRLDPVGMAPVTGACRLPAGQCVRLTPEACGHWEGAFSGVGSSCL